jgi:hypothetical protein
LGIGARQLTARLEVEDLADVCPTLDQLGARGVDVGDDQVQALDGARRHVRAPHDGDRARRAGRCQLHHAEVAGAVVDVEVEARLLEVESLGAVHVRDGEDHQFECPVHDRASWS